MKLKEIGEKFGVGDAAASATSKRLLAQEEKAPNLTPKSLRALQPGIRESIWRLRQVDTALKTLPAACAQFATLQEIRGK